MRNTILLGILVATGVTSGCKQEEPLAFEPNYVHAYKLAMVSGQEMEQPLEDTMWAMHRMFGTPDDPKLPQIVTAETELPEMLPLERLERAAGAEGLYIQHCAKCHGITGNGRGPTAALLDPYPRDFRAGMFKFKSTPLGRKPTKEDLVEIILRGVPGTGMQPIEGLSEEEAAILAEYVIYLSIRGEVERLALRDAAMELDLEAGERLVDPALMESDPEAFEEQWGYLEDYALDAAENWLAAEEQVLEVEVPSDVPESLEAVRDAVNSGEPESVVASIERGAKIFGSERASCAKCHGEKGHGDGQVADYDEWAKDWTARIGLQPEDEAALTPLIARGALPPRKIKPRDFRYGEFRGGEHPADIFRRIRYGIEGTPMPAAPLEPAEIWDLVNYVRSLYEPGFEAEPEPITDAEGEAKAEPGLSQT